MPGFDADFFQCFYRELLRLCAEARPYFASRGPDEWARQHRMLKEAVLLVFALRQQNESEGRAGHRLYEAARIDAAGRCRLITGPVTSPAHSGN